VWESLVGLSFWHSQVLRVYLDLGLDFVAGFRSRTIFELLLQKARGFLVLIVFNRLLSEYVHKVFDEMTVRT
jgi:hypothetical protein